MSVSPCTAQAPEVSGRAKASCLILACAMLATEPYEWQGQWQAHTQDPAARDNRWPLP